MSSSEALEVVSRVAGGGPTVPLGTSGAAERMVRPVTFVTLTAVAATALILVSFHFARRKCSHRVLQRWICLLSRDAVQRIQTTAPAVAAASPRRRV